MKKYLTSNEIMEVVNELTKAENGELLHKTAVISHKAVAIVAAYVYRHRS